MRYIIGIDPANIQSAYCIVDGYTLKPLKFAKLPNEEMYRQMIDDLMSFHLVRGDIVEVAIEMIASYGMPVGREVFDTCVWIGQLKERLKDCEPKYVYRKDEALNLCQSSRANDATIKQALIDRFAYGVPNYGKGTKKAKGWFYGFRADIWAAYAVAVTYADKGGKT